MKLYSKYSYYLLNYAVFGIGFILNLVIGTFGEVSDSAHYFQLLSVALPFLGVLFYYTNYPSSHELKHNYFGYLSAITEKRTFISISFLFALVGLVVFFLKPELAIYDLWIVSNLILFELFCQIDRLKLQFNKVSFFKAYGLIIKSLAILNLIVFRDLDIFFITIMCFNLIVILKYLLKKKDLEFDDFKGHEIKVSGQLLVVGALNSFSQLLLNKYLIAVKSTEVNVVINNLLIRFVSLFSIGLKSFAEKYTISSFQSRYYVQYVFIVLLTLTCFFLKDFPGYILGVASFTTAMCKLDFVKNFLHKKPEFILYSSLTWAATITIAYLEMDNLFASIIIGYFASSAFVLIVSLINRCFGIAVITLNMASTLILLLWIL